MATATITQEAIESRPMRAFTTADVLAGHAIFTLVSKKTGARFTYRVTEREFDDGRVVHFASVLTHTDGDGYAYLGMIDAAGFRRTKNSKIGQSAPSFLAFAWMWKLLEAKQNLLAAAEVWHVGSCLKCGRALTVPESIESGYGPICARKS